MQLRDEELAGLAADLGPLAQPACLYRPIITTGAAGARIAAEWQYLGSWDVVVMPVTRPEAATIGPVRVDAPRLTCICPAETEVAAGDIIELVDGASYDVVGVQALPPETHRTASITAR